MGAAGEGPVGQFADNLAWKLFELRHKNLLSISKAQKIHLTTFTDSDCAILGLVCFRRQGSHVTRSGIKREGHLARCACIAYVLLPDIHRFSECGTAS